MPYFALIPALFGLLASALLARHVLARRRGARAPLAERLDALLPQTQCGQCGYPACRPYAEALAAGSADINQCPPGGDEGIRALARMLGREPKPLDEQHGVHKPRTVARIDESACIGCTLCIQACPVDAILGAAKLMHTVIEAECTGCELCLPPCPVDCIELLPAPPDRWRWRWPLGDSPRRQVRRRADLARLRFDARQRRLAAEQQARAERLARKKASTAEAREDPRKIAIRAAIERTRAKKRAAGADRFRAAPPPDKG